MIVDIANDGAINNLSLNRQCLGFDSVHEPFPIFGKNSKTVEDETIRISYDSVIKSKN